MSKLKSVVASAMNAKTINKKASNLLVDNYDLTGNAVSMYGGANEYFSNMFKEQYPNLIDTYSRDGVCRITWDVDTHWTGRGFSFEPYVQDIDLINVEIDISVQTEEKYEDGTNKEKEYSETVDVSLKDFEKKIVYEKTEEEECKLELREVEIFFDEKKVNVIFNV